MLQLSLTQTGGLECFMFKQLGCCWGYPTPGPHAPFWVLQGLSDKRLCTKGPSRKRRGGRPWQQPVLFLTAQRGRGVAKNRALFLGGTGNPHSRRQTGVFSKRALLCNSTHSRFLKSELGYRCCSLVTPVLKIAFDVANDPTQSKIRTRTGFWNNVANVGLM